MPNIAMVLKVLIASPGDVIIERDAIERAISTWNATYYDEIGIVLAPVRWETHTFPEISRSIADTGPGAVQQIITSQIINNIDILIGVFWTRVGTPTADYVSGTAEEIENILSKSLPAMLYFSNKAIPPDQIENRQLRGVRKLEKQYKNTGLTATFDSVDMLSRRIITDLSKIVALRFPISGKLSRTMPTVISTTFPQELDERLKTANDMFIFGINQSDFLTRYFDVLSARVRAGAKFRVLLVSPNGAAKRMATLRFPGRVDESHEEVRIRNSLRRFKELQSLSASFFEIRVIDYLLPYGGIIFDIDSEHACAYLKHYTFRTGGGSAKPKIVVRRGIDQYFDLIADETLNLWNAAEPYAESIN